MKIIEIPGDLSIKFPNRQGDVEPTTAKFVSWAENIIDYYGDGVKSLKQVRQVQKIIDALKAANGTMQLEDADYDLLKAAIDDYPKKLPPIVVRQHLPFVDAVEKAQEVKK